MKKIIALILALTMVFALAACGKAEPKDRLAQIKEKGVIEICTEPYFAPFEFVDPSKEGDDQFQGCDILLMQMIADKIGVKLKIVPLDFTAVLTGVVDGKYDLAISAIAYSSERAESMNLSKPYLTEINEGEASIYGFLAREEDAGKYTTAESIKGAVVATQSGSVQEGLVKEQLSDYAELKLFSSMTDAFLAVAEKKADVCACAIDSAEIYAQANEGLCTTEFRFYVDTSMNGTVVAAPKENTDSLMAIVNEVIGDQEAGKKLLESYYASSDYAESLGIG